jgi:GntR family transcriptional regulator, transcriptional repressor for pyruvate dehydrogenase complex
VSEREPAVRAYRLLAERIQQAVLDGRLKPGERLPDEGELAAEHGVGRSTVREALRLLGGRGWVHTLRGPGGGVFVSRPDVHAVGRGLGADLAFLVGGEGLSFAELLEARHAHEEYAVALAARRAGPAEVQRVRRLAEDAERLVDDPEAFTEVNVAFHLAISEATHNRVLLLWMSAIREVLGDVMTRAAATRERRMHVAQQHRRIAEAVAAGTPEAAARAMRDHLRDFEADYLDLADGREVS